ncbi:MAG TPA: MEDS domain-containing protein [Sporichthyaceae bacterium]|nr:MEDS domain-containing protein [Sporichthyaceae bacterium]
MRRSGAVAEARGFGPGDHLCWVFDTHEDFRVRAVEFLAEGLDAGERCWYLGSSDVAALRTDLQELGPVDELVGCDALRLVPIEAGYGPDPAQTVRGWARAVEDALVAGHSGLRVVTDCTAVARSAELFHEFARYEMLIDGYYAAGAPLCGMCGFHRPQVGPQRLDELCSLHPSVNLAAAQPFRLHAANPDWALPGIPPALVAVAGEIDLSCVEGFARCLDRSGLFAGGGEMVLDAAELIFIDHRGLVVLDEFARARGGTVVLRDGPYQAGRIVEILELQQVQVEAGSSR